MLKYAYGCLSTARVDKGCLSTVTDAQVRLGMKRDA